MSYDEILIEMGFVHVTGTLWEHPQHREYGMISIDNHKETAWGVMQTLIAKGSQMKVDEMRNVLQIIR